VKFPILVPFSIIIVDNSGRTHTVEHSVPVPTLFAGIYQTFAGITPFVIWAPFNGWQVYTVQHAI
jgi:hypothetical protein